MRELMIGLLLGGACLALIALCQLLDSWNEAEDQALVDEIELDNVTLAEARKEN